jgi:hypothetical protein
VLLVSPPVRRRRRSLRSEKADHSLPTTCTDEFFASPATRRHALDLGQRRMRLYSHGLTAKGKTWEAATVALTAQGLSHQHGLPPFRMCPLYGRDRGFLIAGSSGSRDKSSIKVHFAALFGASAPVLP